MTSLHQRYTQASIATSDNLRSIARSARNLSHLTLPEIDTAVDLIGQIIPAGNVPGMILSGLARLSGRKPPPKAMKRDINLLFKGVNQVLDRATYGAFFAGPAAVIWGYQNLLKLGGIDPEDAFPEGTWQFYVDYALREDTARHANETHGFDTLLNQHNIVLHRSDRITAWVMAAVITLHQYEDLLTNEWRERVYTRHLEEVTAGTSIEDKYKNIYRQWVRKRPFKRRQDAAPDEEYPSYRRRLFDDFLQNSLRTLNEQTYHAWQEKVQQAEQHDLPSYQQQMSILSYLKPGLYGETRTPIPLSQAHIGVIYQGRYYLIAVCTSGSTQLPNIAGIRTQIATILTYPAESTPTSLVPLAETKRSSLPSLTDELPAATITDLHRLRLAPVVLNTDLHPRNLPLSEIRRGERGIGDHPLTIFDIGETFIFDQSHIFFDGAWGVALAEIMTNEALSWAVYLRTLPDAEPANRRPYTLSVNFSQADRVRIEEAPKVTPEVSAETDVVDIQALLKLRRLFKQRSDQLKLTVNDLLVLYRAIHAASYEPSTDLVKELKMVPKDAPAREAAQATLKAIERSRQINPAILIPVDASNRSPCDRLYPVTLEVPINELNLLDLYEQTVKALMAYQHDSGDRTASYAAFDRLQRRYLATLAGFGALMDRVKEVAVSGESGSVGAIKLLAHMPTPLQRMLDQIPGRFDILNDIIKGNEVFSNVGAVAPTSTLTRFISAKDDNEKKVLVWGVLTDAQGVMRISLRDFRPYVGYLSAAGQRNIAERVAQDYLEAYAYGLNDYVRNLGRIVEASRETRLYKPEGRDE